MVSLLTSSLAYCQTSGGFPSHLISNFIATSYVCPKVRPAVVVLCIAMAEHVAISADEHPALAAIVAEVFADGFVCDAVGHVYILLLGGGAGPEPRGLGCQIV